MVCPEAPRHVHTLTLPLPLRPCPPPRPPLALLQDVFSRCPARLLYKHHFNPVMPQLRASRCLQNKGQTHLEAELSLPCLALAASLPPPQGCALPSHHTSLHLHLLKPYPSCRPGSSTPHSFCKHLLNENHTPATSPGSLPQSPLPEAAAPTETPKKGLCYTPGLSNTYLSAPP